jgi:hypothetical protein
VPGFAVNLYCYPSRIALQCKIYKAVIAVNVNKRVLQMHVLGFLRTENLTEQIDKKIFCGTVAPGFFEIVLHSSSINAICCNLVSVALAFVASSRLSSSNAYVLHG